MQSGDEHFHVYGRKGELIGVVNTDATRSHGGKPFRLPDGDADALRVLGVPVPKNNIIEWIELAPAVALLLG